MIFYRLNKQIDSNSIIRDIQNLLTKYSQDQLENLVLTINIKHIYEENNTTQVKNLEYQKTNPA